MWTLEFEDTYRVLLVRFSGILVSEKISELDRVVPAVVAWGGPLHGLLFDCTAVTASAVPQSFIAFRASLPLISSAFQRVFIVPTAELRRLAEAYASQQRHFGIKAPHLVASLSDACKLLQLERPHFRPATVDGMYEG